MNFTKGYNAIQIFAYIYSPISNSSPLMSLVDKQAKIKLRKFQIIFIIIYYRLPHERVDFLFRVVL